MPALVQVHPPRPCAQHYHRQQHRHNPVQREASDRKLESRPLDYRHRKQCLPESAGVRSGGLRELTARKVPGRKTVVSKASAFIAAPSFIPAAAIMRPEMASRVVMKLYTCAY